MSVAGRYSGCIQPAMRGDDFSLSSREVGGHPHLIHHRQTTDFSGTRARVCFPRRTDRKRIA